VKAHSTSSSEAPPAATVVPSRPAGDRRQLGAVYTPDPLARWVASLLRDHARAEITSVLDPACGDGALLAAADTELQGVRELVGVDLSEAAISSVKELWPDRARALVADTLTLTRESFPAVQAVFMNPPWGAEISQSREQLRDTGFELATGQCDSWDLFVEWAVRRLPGGVVVAAILPDALFLPEHTPTRRLLITDTDVRVVARLGEGWFDGVCRGVAVVVFVTGGPSEYGDVRCIRLPHDARRRVLAGDLGLAEAVSTVESVGDQAVWAADPQARLTAGLAQSDVPTIQHFEQRGGDWTRWVSVGRGAEMGKAGHLLRCDNCQRHSPKPQSLPGACQGCGHVGAWSIMRAVSMAPPDDGTPWVPFIVGEDVGRYETHPSRWLRLGLKGVNYKDPLIYATPKLLVRKTGLGLNAAVDRSGSHTNQVVFHYLALPGAPEFLLHYLEGVLCSRVLLAYHLRRSGETEWRSHPYVTPKVLATLPIPAPVEGTASWNQARAIADAAQAVGKASLRLRGSAELAVDQLVAGLFELDDTACDWVSSVLAETQRLQAFAPFVLPQGLVLRPELAA
jgi:adenine-specific DNA-methyltransferase